MVTPSEKSLKWTLGGLALIAVLSAGLAWLFVQLWTQHLEAEETRYFKDQGFERARAIKDELDNRLTTQLVGERFQPHGRWTTPFPIVFKNFEQEVTRSSALAANEVSLIDGSLRRKGQDGVIYTIGQRFPPYPSEGQVRDDLTFAVSEGKGFTTVYVWGQIALPQGAPEDLIDKAYAFRCVLRYQSLPTVGDTGGRFAALLLCSFLALLWLVVIGVYILDRRRLRLQMQSQEKSIRLGAMAQVAEGIAHEVRNPLNGISLNVQYLQKLQEKGVGATGEDYQRVYVELKKIQNVIDDFVTFSRLEDIELETLTLNELIDDVMEELAPLVNDVGAQIDRHCEREVEFRGDHAKLVQALKAVIRNSLEALAEEELPRTLTIQLDGDRNTVQCAIENIGRPLEPMVLKSMFDPFYTTRSSAMGLGLTLAKTIFEAHGGKVEALAPPAGGCRLEIELPRRF